MFALSLSLSQTSNMILLDDVEITVQMYCMNLATDCVLRTSLTS